MSHLGDLAAALADNELAADARDRALGHVASCTDCRVEVDQQRRVRSLLANQADPEMPSDLGARLRAIGADQGNQEPKGRLESKQPQGSLAPQERSQRRERSWPVLAATGFAPAPSRPAGTRRPRFAGSPGRPGQQHRRRIVRTAIAGGVAALALTAGLATVGGQAASSGPTTNPPVDRFVQEHTVMTARLPFGDAGAALVESVVLER